MSVLQKSDFTYLPCSKKKDSSGNSLANFSKDFIAEVQNGAKSSSKKDSQGLTKKYNAILSQFHANKSISVLCLHD